MAITKVNEFLEKRKITLHFLPVPDGLVEFDDFLIPWYELLIFGGFVLAVGVEAGTGIVTIPTILFAYQLSPGELAGVASGATIIVTAYLLYVVGIWTGTRCDKRHLFTLFGVAILGLTIAHIGDFLVLSSNDFRDIFGVDKSVSIFFRAVVFGSIFAAVVVATFGLLGLRRGHRHRLGRYAEFLLGKIPGEEKQAFLDMMHEDAKRLSPPGPDSGSKAPI